MAAETARQFEALERQAAGLMAVFMRAGCEAVAPAVIQPANVFLDVIGEGLRSRTYVFSDPEGHELCLRPDLTVPTCRIHLARHESATTPARYCYNGPAFRFQQHGADAAHPNEFRQAGIEMIGDADHGQAEVEVLELILAALRTAGLKDRRVRMGDLGLFQALLADVDIPERGRQRLRAQFWRPDAFRQALGRLSERPAGSLKGLPADLVTRLDAVLPEGGSKQSAEAVVGQYLEDNAVTLVGVRTLAEITESLLAAVVDARSEPIAGATASLIERYLRIKGPATTVADEIDAVLAGAGPRSRLAVAAYRRRLELLARAGIDPAGIEFAAEFGRNLEYYTGFVFDIVASALGAQSPIAGGGRYDNLMQAVGAPCPVAAVGSAIHTQRLLDVVSGAAPGNVVSGAAQSKAASGGVS